MKGITKMKEYNLVQDENGSVMVIVAISLSLLLIVCSVALDFALVYMNIGRAQSALDAAVLAAGRLLPVSQNDEASKDSIKNIINDYLTKNGMVDLSTLTINFTNLNGTQYKGIEAKLTVKTELNFAKIIGKDYINITKGSEVKILPSVRMSDVSPLGVRKEELDSHIASGELTHIPLKYGGGGGTTGDFGAIDLDGVNGGGASDYERWLTYGYTTELTINQGLFPVETGNMAGPTETAINTRYSDCKHFPSDGGCNSRHFVATCLRVIKIPVIVYSDSRTIKIVAFAAFVLEAPTDSKNGYVTGSFVNMVLPGTPAETEDDINNADYGLYSLRLSK